METNKNIEGIFRDRFEHFEEMPSQSVWEAVSNKIPIYLVASTESGLTDAVQQGINHGNSLVNTILSVKGIIISGVMVSTLVGSFVIYNQNKNEDTNEIKKQFIQQEKVNEELVKEKSVELVPVKETQEIKVENSKQIPEKLKVAPNMTKNDVILGIDNDFAIPADTSDKVGEEKKIETVEHKITKPETFYEKKARLMKDSTRNVFKPE